MNILAERKTEPFKKKKNVRMWTMGSVGEEVISHVAVNIWVTESRGSGLFATSIIVLRSSCDSAARLWKNLPFYCPHSRIPAVGFVCLCIG